MGITRPALYHYIKRKQEILINTFDKVTDILLDKSGPIIESDFAPDVKMERIIANHIRVVIENKTLLGVFYSEKSELPEQKRAYILKREREYGKMIEQIYREGIEQGIFKNIDSGILVNCILGMFNWMHLWYKPEGRLNIEEAIETIINLIQNGCKRR